MHTASFLGKPKELAAEYSHDEIKDVRTSKPRGGNSEVFVTFVDDSVITLYMG